MYIDLPNISEGGTVEQQVAQIKTYIFKLNEQLKVILPNLTTEKIWQETESAIQNSDSSNKNAMINASVRKIFNQLQEGEIK